MADIELSTEELWDLKTESHKQGIKSICIDDLEVIISALNTVRNGDSRLTIRKEPGRGRVYVRCDDDMQAPFWVQVDAQGNTRLTRDREINSYPVVYRPEE